MKILKSIGICFKALILIFIIFPISIMAQEGFKSSSPAIEKLYEISQSYYSVNDEFINGFIYPIPNTRIPGDPYLNNPNWSDGTLFINGKTYSHLSVKYDLIIDELIIKFKTEQNIERLLAVNKSQIDSFIIHSSLFLSSRNLFPDEEKFTYFEKIYEGKLAVYRHYEKNFIDLYNNNSPAGKYSIQKSTTYLIDNKKLTNISNTRLFLNYFEKTEQEKIKKYLKVNKINYSKISNSQLVELISYCATIISQVK